MQPDIEPYLKSVRTICPDVTEHELAQFASKLTIKQLNKKEFFVASERIQHAIGFITSGLARSFFVDQAGNEITVGFYAERDYATHYSAFLAQTPSRYNIQCLETTTFVCLSFEGMQWAYRQFPKFEKYGRLVAEEILKRQQARIESFIFKTAEERYLDFVGQHSNLFNRVSLSHLCSFLGIERQTLTRIRQKISRK